MKGNSSSEKLPVFLGARVARAEAGPRLDVGAHSYLALSS